jgi:ribonuclease P protein subunit RPR2
MTVWAVWLAIGLAAWLLVSAVAALILGRTFALLGRQQGVTEPRLRRPEPEQVIAERGARLLGTQPRRVLVVDDDPALRLLLRTTLAADEFAVEEAESAEDAAELVRTWRPSVVILDVGLPGIDGIAFLRQLRADARFGKPFVILLTGAEASGEQARAAGADALLRKPFSPLDLTALLDRGSDSARATRVGSPAGGSDEQLLVYARDLSHLLQAERAQRRLLQHAYRQTVTTLSDALETRDPATGTHALRVQRYALELTEAVESSLLDDPSLEYGYLLHDIGKIGIPDRILNKPGPLNRDELRVMRRHPCIGAEMLDGIALLEGEGIRTVRSHHERWDGRGYPDGLAADEIPLGARIFAVADTLDAITTDRPYRPARSWQAAIDELLSGDGTQFDPRIITAFAVREQRLRHIHDELLVAA